MITGLAHVCYVVADLERSVRFYCDQLGLPEAFAFRREDGTRYGVYLKTGRRTFIELFQGQVAGRAEGQSFQHICLEVSELSPMVGVLRGRGIEVSDPKLGMDHSWQAWLADPDGNRIELHEYTDASWQTPHL